MLWILVLAFTDYRGQPHTTIHQVFETKSECVQRLNSITTGDLWNGQKLIYKDSPHGTYSIRHILQDEDGKSHINSCSRAVNE